MNDTEIELCLIARVLGCRIDDRVRMCNVIDLMFYNNTLHYGIQYEKLLRSIDNIEAYLDWNEVNLHVLTDDMVDKILYAKERDVVLQIDWF